MPSTSKDFIHFVRHLRFEAFALAALMVALTYKSPAPLWVLPASFMIFDICMVGYAFNAHVGALLYNFTHNAAVPTLAITLGVMINNDIVSVIGFCWTFHIAVDRMLGYGLKHDHSFAHTHLGKIGRPGK